MVSPETVANLAAARTFSVLNVSTLHSLAGLFRQVRVAPGQTLSREGEIDASLYVIIDGAVALDRRDASGSPRHLMTVGYGEVLGERGVFADLESNATAVALQPSLALVADRDELWGALALDPGALDLLVLPDDVRQRINLPRSRAADIGERTVAVIRKHWAALAANLVLPIAVTAGSLLLAATVTSFVSTSGAVLALAALGIGLPAATFAYAVLDYRNDLLILTNRRVIRHKRTPLVRSRRTEVPLDRVQDIQVVVPGVAARTLGYGTLRVQSAGAGDCLEVDALARPEEVRATLFRLAELASVQVRQERTGWIAERLAPALAAEPDIVPIPGVGDEPTASTPAASVGFAAALGEAISRRRNPSPSSDLVWRKHWWFLVRGSGLVFAAGLASLAAMLRTVAVGGPIPGEVWLAVASALGLWSTYRYQDWRNDVYILDDEHIVDVERKPFGLFTDRREAPLVQIQDIRHVVPNPLATLLGFGDVIVETAAESGRFTFHGVPRPQDVHEEIFTRIERRKAAAERHGDEKRAEEMAEWFRAYHQLSRAAGYVEVNKGLATSEGIG